MSCRSCIMINIINISDYLYSSCRRKKGLFELSLTSNVEINLYNNPYGLEDFSLKIMIYQII